MAKKAPAPAKKKTSAKPAKSAKSSKPSKVKKPAAKKAPAKKVSPKKAVKPARGKSPAKVAPAKKKHPLTKSSAHSVRTPVKKPSQKSAAKKAPTSKAPAKPAKKIAAHAKPAPKAKSSPAALKAKQAAAKALAAALAKAKAKKTASAKPAAKAPAKPAAKPAPKSAAKAPASKQPAKPVVKAPAKAAPAAKAPAKPTAKPADKSAAKPSAKPAPKPEATKAPATKGAPAKQAVSAKDRLRSNILARREKPAKPIAFTLDEVREIAAAQAASETTPEQSAAAAAKAKATKLAEAEAAARSAKPNRVKAASLADILGFNPTASKSAAANEEDQIPEKFRRYYKLLIDLRNHASGKLNEHSEETLRRSAKDDAGDLSSYGQHMADAGTDTFDRDFALSMVASEQEALTEIEAAIQRIKNGTYGICELTQKPIARERLTAVPFARYSTEAQKEVEKNRYRARGQAGLFGEMGDDGAKMMDDVDGDD